MKKQRVRAQWNMLARGVSFVTPEQAEYARNQRKPLIHHVCEARCCTAQVRKMGVKY